MSTAQGSREEFVTCRGVRDRKRVRRQCLASLVKRHFSWFVVDGGGRPPHLLVKAATCREPSLLPANRVCISCGQLLLPHHNAPLQIEVRLISASTTSRVNCFSSLFILI
ncbi:hypothetical protein ACOSQ4_002329 [Xanthoceras sorbifolium]